MPKYTIRTTTAAATGTKVIEKKQPSHRESKG